MEVCMSQVASINFVDKDSGDEAWIGVRAIGEIVGLAVSLKKDGDIAVFFTPKELDLIVAALQKARAIVSSGN